MPKGPLRTAIDDLLNSNPVTAWLKAYNDRVQARGFVVSDTYLKAPVSKWIPPAIWPLLALVVGWIYMFTGFETPFRLFVTHHLEKPYPDISELVIPILQKAGSDPLVHELTETFGALATEPILALFEQYAGRDDVDPKEFARSFHGLIYTLNSLGGVANFAVQAATAGQVKGVDEYVKGLYWNLGLGFLGWQTLAPLLSAGLQPGLERYYQKLYRPKRFAASDLRDLYALGKISLEQLKEEARLIGWREQDIQTWIDLAFRNISESDVWQLYHADKLTQQQVTVRLSQLGYAAADIPLLFQANQKKEVAEAADVTLSTARAAYRDDLMSEQEFRAALRALKKSDAEANLIVALENRNKLEAFQRLSVSQIKAAWEENVLSDTEARTWLTRDGIPAEQVNILIATWQKENEPEFRKLNRGTIIAAYIAGILNRQQAGTKLTSLGFTTPDAVLELDLAEAQNPAAFGRPLPKPARLLTPGNLADLVVAGLITPEEMRAKLVTAGYNDNDARLLSELARLEAAGQFRLLTQATIERAYISHVLTRELALQRLRELSLDENSAAVVLATVERENPDAFGEAAAAAPRALPLNVLASAVLSSLLTEAEYLSRAREMDYTADDAALFLEIARQTASERPREVSQSTIERAYVLQVIDRAKAAARLKELGFEDADVETILQSVERDNPSVFAPGTLQATRQPTMAALVEAFRSEIITEQEYFARAAEAGYDQPSAQVYLSLAVVAERKSIKRLSDAKILDLYAKGIFDRPETERRLTENGYNQTDAQLLMRLEKSGVTDTQTWSDFIASLITVEDAIAQLLSQSFTIEEIQEAFAKAGG